MAKASNKTQAQQEINASDYSFTLSVPKATMQGNVKSYNGQHVKQFCDQLRGNFAAHLDAATVAARDYTLYAIETKNCDLLRMLWEALPVKYQPSFTSWVKHVTGGCVVKRTKTHTDTTGKQSKSVSFGLDKKQVRRSSLAIHDMKAFEQGFIAWKAPKKEQDESLKALLLKIEKRLDGALTIADEHTEDSTVFKSALDILRKASNEVSALTIPKGIEATDVAQEQEKRDELAKNVVDITTNEANNAKEAG
jgi:hypothetical protein